MGSPDVAACQFPGCSGIGPDGMCPNGYGVTCEAYVPHEEEDYGALFEPHQPLSPEVVAALREHGVDVPTWRPEARSAPAPRDMREWVVLRSQVRTQVFRGIFAGSAQEAMDAFLDGAGELDQDADRYGPWELDAELARTADAEGGEERTQ